MPFAGFENFEDCVSSMMTKQGYDEETAKKTCGMLQAKQEGKMSEENMTILSDITDYDLSKEFEVLRTGEFYDSRYGKFEVTDQLLSELEQNFRNNVLNIQVALDVGHEPVKGAVAWIDNIRKDGNRLLMRLKDITEEGKKYLKDKVFKYFSVEFAPFKKVIDGKITNFKNVLRGVALTNRPVIKDIQPAFYAESYNILTFYPMKNFKIVAENVLSSDNVTDNDIKMLTKLSEELSEENKKEAEKMIEQVKVKFQEKEEEKEEEKDEEEEEKEEEKKELSEMKKENETLMMQLAEHKKLIDQTQTKLRKKELEEKVNGTLLLSEKNNTGIIEKDAPEFVNFLMNLSEDKAQKAIELFKKIKTVDFKEYGEAGGTDLSEQQRFDQMVAEKVKAGMRLGEAQKVVARENPELAKKIL